MRWIAMESKCSDGFVWIVKDMELKDGIDNYVGPFASEAKAVAFARPKNSAAWREMLGRARVRRCKEAAEAQ
jgi:hypothetical protein